MENKSIFIGISLIIVSIVIGGSMIIVQLIKDGKAWERQQIQIKADKQMQPLKKSY